MIKKINTCILLALLFFTSCSEEEENIKTHYTRTVLVYMAADNNLSPQADINIAQMKQDRVSGNLDNGNWVVYIDRINKPPQLIQIDKHGETILKSYPEQNSASPEIMRTVIDEVRTRFPSDKYGLVLWSHATAWIPANTSYAEIGFNLRLSQEQPALIRDPGSKAFAQDGENGTDWLELSDLASALPDKFFDFILFDACYMGSVEVAFELRNKANTLLFSPTEVLVRGFPYDKITNKLLELNPDLSEISRIYFETYQNLSGLEQSASISLVQTSELQNLSGIVKEIIQNPGKSTPLNITGIQCYDRFKQHILFDLDDYIEQLANPDQWNRFREQLNRTVIFKSATSRFYNTFDIRRFSGLSIYIPQETLASLNQFYFNQLDWGKQIIR